MVLLQENYTFPGVQMGSNIFQGSIRGPKFSRGVQLFLGGGRGCPNVNFCRNPYNL